MSKIFEICVKELKAEKSSVIQLENPWWKDYGKFSSGGLKNCISSTFENIIARAKFWFISPQIKLGKG